MPDRKQAPTNGMSDEEFSVLLVGFTALYLGISAGHRVAVGTWFGDRTPIVAGAGLLCGLALLARERWLRAPYGRGVQALVRLLGVACVVAGGYWFVQFARSPPPLAGLGSLATVAWLAGGAVFVTICGVGVAGGAGARESPWFVRSIIGVSALAMAGLFGVVLVATGLY